MNAHTCWISQQIPGIWRSVSQSLDCYYKSLTLTSIFFQPDQDFLCMWSPVILWIGWRFCRWIHSCTQICPFLHLIINQHILIGQLVCAGHWAAWNICCGTHTSQHFWSSLDLANDPSLGLENMVSIVGHAHHCSKESCGVWCLSQWHNP